jgi:hypothetical protein
MGRTPSWVSPTIWKISRQSSGHVGLRATGTCLRDSHFQYILNPGLCQPTTVSGWLSACGFCPSETTEGTCTAGTDPNCLLYFAGTLPGVGHRRSQSRCKILCLLIPANGAKPREKHFPAVQKQYKKSGIFRKGLDYKEISLAPQVGLEPTTLRLTAECSAIELLRSAWRWIVLIYVSRGRQVRQKEGSGRL